MKFIGSLFVYGGLYFIYSASFGARNFEIGVLVLACIIAFPIIGIGKLIINAGAGTVQEKADNFAEEIARNPGLFTGHFVLYLRPFETTNQFKIDIALGNIFDLDQYWRDGYDDIERVLAQSVADSLPIVTVGMPGEHRGAGRFVTSDAEWQALVLALIRNANFIVMLPGPNAGTTWEMQQIANASLLGRCLLLMPPSNNSSYSSPGNVAGRWHETTESWSRFGVILPGFQEAGALLRHVTAGRFEIASPLPQPNPGAWRRELQNIIDMGYLQATAVSTA